MNLPMIIGRKSDNQIVTFNLIEMPHLFISYYEKYQFEAYFSNHLNLLFSSKSITDINLAISVNKNIYINHHHWENSLIAHRFWNDISQEFSLSKEGYFKNIFTIFKSRLKLLKKKEYLIFDKTLPYCLIIVDDIFELILNQKQQVGIQFLQLLVYGHKVGMHVIAGSISSYRNLIIQLNNLHPISEQILQKQSFKIENQKIKPIGAELIFTPDNLWFFKPITEPIHERFFPY